MTRRSRPIQRHVLASVLTLAAVNAATAADLVWPTPNRAAEEGRPYAEFVQPTESGLVESGLFGCGRSSGSQFHEGLDLRPLRRDQKGEAADPVFAMLPGEVRYANHSPGSSNYGRYVIVEHREDGLNFISLYAHLSSIDAGARIDAAVTAGQPLGIMGRSAGNAPIPRERAHVHVEMGFWLSRNFQTWYHGKKFPNKNEHGAFNGMNVVSFDFLDFVERRRAGEVRGVREYVARLPTAVTVFVRSPRVPDFVERYPGLLGAALPAEDIAGWRIDFTWFGLPKAWWPVVSAEAEAHKTAGREIVFADGALLGRFPCQRVVRTRNGRHLIGPKLQDALDILFAGL